MMPMSGEQRPMPLIRGSFSVPSAQLSPDGRWLAYTSTETGRAELYLTEFPQPRTKRPVTTGGGDHPRWRADGQELFFRSSGKLMAVDVMQRPAAIAIGTTRELFDIRDAMGAGGASRYFYDVSPDGQRFLFGVRMTAGQRIGLGEWARSITVLINWPAALRGE